MKASLLFAACTVLLCCQQPTAVLSITENPFPPFEYISSTYPEGSWKHFLQNLPTKQGAVVDYRESPVKDQDKAAAIVSFDIGSRDLQQCADALMRLRAEYLFSRGRFADIRFHFTSGHLYTFTDYCKGRRPQVVGNQVRFNSQVASSATNHENLRQYLDIVYAYAGTISLAKELSPTNKLDVGTVVIYPGSPGHCFIVVDTRITSKGKRQFKLAEGYTPAQSIYILQNEETNSPWHDLNEGQTIRTASFVFRSYQLGVFE